MKKAERRLSLKGVFIRAINMWTAGNLRKLWRLGLLYRLWHRAAQRRRRAALERGVRVPIAIALSPTARCNLSCRGCYARDYPRDGELPLEVINRTVWDAERLGVFLFVITGGEPFLREDMLEIYKNYQNTLFLVITNGTQITSRMARELARLRNLIVIVSVEGFQAETDWRRGGGTYDRVRRCMANLRMAGVLFGFAAMVTRRNLKTLGDETFIDRMIQWGCALGFYNEYVPVGRGADWNLVLKEEEKEWLRERILDLRRRKPMVIVHLPDDEYDEDGRCLAVGGGSFHINAQGYVEPCPFTHYARDNIKEQTLEEVLRSPFLREIQTHPTILKRRKYGCALFENREVVREIAKKTGAKMTERNSQKRR